MLAIEQGISAHLFRLKVSRNCALAFKILQVVTSVTRPGDLEKSGYSTAIQLQFSASDDPAGSPQRASVEIRTVPLFDPFRNETEIKQLSSEFPT